MASVSPSDDIKPPKFRRGKLKNGSPSGDFMKASRCGAKNRQGNPCQCPAMRGKARCRLHGGKSTGARTKAGIHRIRTVHWKHGFRSGRLLAEAKAMSEERTRELMQDNDEWLDGKDCRLPTVLGTAGSSAGKSSRPSQMSGWTSGRMGE